MLQVLMFCACHLVRKTFLRFWKKSFKVSHMLRRKTLVRLIWSSWAVRPTMSLRQTHWKETCWIDRVSPSLFLLGVLWYWLQIELSSHYRWIVWPCHSLCSYGSSSRFDEDNFIMKRCWTTMEVHPVLRMTARFLDMNIGFFLMALEVWWREESGSNAFILNA